MSKVRYKALRGGNYRKGGVEAVAGEVYGDISEDLVASADLVGRRVVERVGGEPDYADTPVEQLEALAAARELEVEGTGAGGRVLKTDLVTALEAADRDDPEREVTHNA